MSRQIRIRIWDKQNRKWLFQGDVLSEAMLLSLSMIDDYSNYKISQFTGLKDVNGREIWEGDYFLKDGCLCTIVYDFGRYWAEFYMGTGIEIHDLFDNYKKKQNFVMGNIYEDKWEDVRDLIPRLIQESES